MIKIPSSGGGGGDGGRNDGIELITAGTSYSDNFFSKLLQVVKKIPGPTENPDAIIQYHPTKPLLAVALNSSVLLYDSTTGQWKTIRSDVVEGGIFAMVWCHEIESLILGLSTGVLYLRLSTSTDTQAASNTVGCTYRKWFQHPKRKAVNNLAASPQGRMFASLSSNENVVYIWDSMSLDDSCCPLYCLDGNSGDGISWWGQGLLVTDSIGNASVLNAYDWSIGSRCNFGAPLNAVCWIGNDLFLANPRHTRTLFFGKMIHGPNTSPSSVSVSLKVQSSPYELSVNDLSQCSTGSWGGSDCSGDLFIDKVAASTNGRLVAVSFVPTKGGQPLPLVGVYLCSGGEATSYESHNLTLTLVKIFTADGGDVLDSSVRYCRSISSDELPPSAGIYPVSLTFCNQVSNSNSRNSGGGSGGGSGSSGSFGNGGYGGGYQVGVKSGSTPLSSDLDQLAIVWSVDAVSIEQL